MELTERETYTSRGLDDAAQQRLASLGDLILGAGFNVTAIREPREIERGHFLDSLSLLELDCVVSARRIVDVGTGAGFPALVLALAVSGARIVALDSSRKKCDHVARAVALLGLENVEVWCGRVEDYGRGHGRADHDLVVSRALASLPVVAEYSAPLLRVGGTMVSMKGAVSDQERIHADKALGILGCGPLEAERLHPFAGAENRWAYVSHKLRRTPEDYPRRPGSAVKRPLGA